MGPLATYRAVLVFVCDNMGGRRELCRCLLVARVGKAVDAAKYPAMHKQHLNNKELSSHRSIVRKLRNPGYITK